MNDKKIKIHYEGELMGEVAMINVNDVATVPVTNQLRITSDSTQSFLLANGPTDEDAARKQEGRRRLDNLIEERDKNRERFMEAVEVLHTKETKHELITTFGIAQQLTAEIHELSNELRRETSVPNCTLEDIVRNSGMTDEADITRMIHDKMEEIEYLRGVLRVMARSNPPE